MTRRGPLRIFQVISASANAAVTENRTWLRNLHEPLLDMGHDVYLFAAEEGRKAQRQKDVRARKAFSQKLVDTFRAEHQKQPFDLFFSYLIDGMVEARSIDEIRSASVPAVNFSCNDAHQFYLVDELAPHFNLNLHAERDARDKFLAIGARPMWWPMASNPNYFKPYDISRDFDVSFAGGNYGLRARFIGHLLDNGIDLHAFGPNWQYAARSPMRGFLKRNYYLAKTLTAGGAHTRARASGTLADHDYRFHLWKKYPENLHGPPSDDDLILLYSRSHISLGFLEVYDHHDPSRTVIRHIHLREFEAPMCGALYCTGYSDELTEMFEPDKEVVVYRNADELLDKVRYYLAHPNQAETIRQAGYRRALNDHTYHKRFERLFAELGL